MELPVFVGICAVAILSRDILLAFKEYIGRMLP